MHSKKSIFFVRIIFGLTTLMLPLISSASVVASTQGMETATVFNSPTHGQVLRAGDTLYVSGKTTIQSCTSYVYHGRFRIGSPAGCQDPAWSAPITECGVTFYFTDETNTTRPLSAHSGTYRANFSKNSDSIKCDFDKFIPVPSLSPGNYIVWAYIIWGQNNQDPTGDCGDVCGTNLSAWGEHVTISNNAPIDDKPMLVFRADSHVVQAGGTTNLRWRTFNVSSCAASNDNGNTWSGNRPIADTAEQAESTSAINAKTTFTLACTGPKGTIIRSVVVDTRPAPTADIKADGSDGPISKVKGDAVRISWTASNADLCTISGFVTGGSSSGYPGSRNDTLNTAKSSNNYFINCSSSVGVVSDKVTVNISPPKPDLTASQLQVASGVLTAGSQITFSALIKNIDSRANAGASNAHFEVDGVALNPDASVNALSAGASQTVSSGSWTAVQGNHTVRACADSAAVVNESNEGNNCTSGSDDLAIQISGPPAPDLTVTTPQVAGALVDGNTVTLSTIVKNEGNADAIHVNPIQTKFQLDLNNSTFQNADLMIAATDIATMLVASSQQTVSGSWSSIPPGTHTVHVCTDTSNVVTESNESNNCSGSVAGVPADFVITIGNKPDLTPMASPTISGIFDFNQPLTFSATIKNQGGSIASNFANRFYIDLGNDNIGSTNLGNGAFADLSVVPNPNSLMTLSVGNQSAITSNAWSTSTPGTNRIIVCADTTSVVSESNESNNCSGTAAQQGNNDGVFSVGRKPDLIISIAPSLNSGTPQEGFDLTFRTTVKNQGQVATPSGFTSRFYIDYNNDNVGPITLSNGKKADVAINPPDPASPSLTPNATDDIISAPWTAIAGTHRFIVCADDPNNAIQEMDETNNCSNTSGMGTSGTGIILIGRAQQF